MSPERCNFWDQIKAATHVQIQPYTPDKEQYASEEPYTKEVIMSFLVEQANESGPIFLRARQDERCVFVLHLNAQASMVF